MKYAIVVPDGAADVALDELDGRTPFQAADLPTFDALARTGRIGTVANLPEGLPAGSDVATLSVLGYDPADCYTGRAPLEAAAQDIRTRDDEWIFRCNLVTILEGVMQDHSAGHITDTEARRLIADLQAALGSESARFHPGVSYRHLLITDADLDVTCTPPHDILAQPADAHLPRGKGAKTLIDLMLDARPIFVDHEINNVRRDLGENPATDIWLWGQGKMPRLTHFTDRFGLRGAAVSAVDLVRGLAKLIGWDVLHVEGATGLVDTNYQGKTEAAIAALEDHDIALVHLEGTDEAGHQGDAHAKILGLERIDQLVVKPLLERLRQEGEDWRLLVLPDHPTPCTVRTHTRTPVPFVIAGKHMVPVYTGPFDEDTAAGSDLHIARGCDLMEFFLTVR
jgi:2,3-bisphosphoglycerate-independent phosphoglycerate mutase